MKTILIQTENSRGKEARVSTFDDKMKLTIYFKGYYGGVRSETIYLTRTDSGNLTIENDNQLLLRTEGKVANKLGIK